VASVKVQLLYPLSAAEKRLYTVWLSNKMWPPALYSYQ